MLDEKRTFLSTLLVWKDVDPEDEDNNESEGVGGEVEDAELVTIGSFLVLARWRQELLNTGGE